MYSLRFRIARWVLAHRKLAWAVFILITARRVVELEPIQPVAADGSVTISGKLLTPATGLYGLVTQGE